MNNGQNPLVPLKQVSFTVDTVRLVSDNSDGMRDTAAAEFLRSHGIRNHFFPVGTQGASASFANELVYNLVLYDHRRGQIREFHFVDLNGGQRVEIDDGEVFVCPDSLDDDKLLNFECRSRKYKMKWYFACKPKVTDIDSSVDGSKAKAEPAPADLAPPESQPTFSTATDNEQTKLTGSATAQVAEETQPSVASSKPVAASTNEPSQERNGGTMASPKSLVEYLFIAFCKEFNADKSEAESGARGENNCCTDARRATIYLSKKLGVQTSVISSVKGMPSQSNTSSQYNFAMKQYGNGKNEFAAKIKVVQDNIPDDLLPKPVVNGEQTEPSTAEPTAKRRVPKPKADEQSVRASSGTTSPRREAVSGAGLEIDMDLPIFILVQNGATAVDLAEKFNVSVGEVHRAFGRFSMAVAQGNPDILALIGLVKKIQSS